MNDTPTTAPIQTTDTPVTVTAPLADVPAPVANTAVADQAEPRGRGRVASPRTVAIRTLLDDSNGEITFSVAEPLLQKMGFETDENSFNVTKSAWKRAKRPDTVRVRTAKPRAERKVNRKANRKVAKAAGRPKRELPAVTDTEALAFVSEAGGLAKAQANILREIALLKAFKALVKQTSKLAA